MLNNIKIYRYTVGRSNSLLTYTAVDISNQMSATINDTAVQDETLDYTSVVLYNTDSQPLAPFTRFKIVLTDDTAATENIYRYLDKDSVERIVPGTSPLYRHTLALVEITKITERVPVENITFTNYLDRNYGTENIVAYKYQAYFEPGGLGTYYEATYNSSLRILGPYKIADATQESTVPLSVLAYFGDGTPTTTPDVLSYKVLEPDGGVHLFIEAVEVPGDYGTIQINPTVRDTAPYTYTKQGKHTWVMDVGYKDAAEAGRNRALYTWDVTCILTAAEYDKYAIKKYTLLGVLNRLLEVCELRRYVLDRQRFSVHPDMVSILQSRESPEFSFTQSTLWEALALIGKEINGVPRLVPSGADDTSWSLITFDIVGGAGTAPALTDTLYDAASDATDYAQTFTSRLQNVTQTSTQGTFATVAPYAGGWITPRAADATLEISNDAGILSPASNQGIQFVTKVEYYDKANDTVYDVTQYVLEQAEYNIRDDYEGVNGKNKALYYVRGGKVIDGLMFTAPTAIALEVNLPAWKNVLTEAGTPLPASGNIKDTLWRITYVPITSLTLRHPKPRITSPQEPNSLYYNQSANAIDINAFGANIREAIDRSGNNTVTQTGYFPTLSGVPSVGQSGTNGYAYAVSRELHAGLPIKATIAWSNNYVALSSIAIKKAIRQFEISEKESVERELIYDSYLIMTKAITGQPLSAEDPAETLPMRNALAARLSGTLTESKRISYAVGTCTDSVGTEKTFIIPATSTGIGNTCIQRFALLDNYAAGTKVIKSEGEYDAQGYARYTDDFGRFETMRLQLGATNPLTATTPDEIIIGRAINGIPDGYTVNTSDLIYDTSKVNPRPFIVRKDSREQISMTMQQHYISDSDGLTIGAAMAMHTPWVSNLDTALHYVFFTVSPDPRAMYVDPSIYDIGDMPSCTVDNTYSYMTIPAVATSYGMLYVGFGMVDDSSRLLWYCSGYDAVNQTSYPVYIFLRRFAK